MNTDMFGLFQLQVISVVFAHDLSPCVAYDRLLASEAWWMPLVEHDLIYHLAPLFLTPGLMGLLLLKLWFSYEDQCFPFIFLFLIFVLLYVSFGYKDGVFWLFLCLLGLKLSLYLLRILYFLVICILIRLHQSKQAHSTTWQALLIYKYKIISIFMPPQLLVRVILVYPCPSVRPSVGVSVRRYVRASMRPCVHVSVTLSMHSLSG